MAEFEVQIKEENLVFRKSPVLTDKVMHYCPGCSHGTVHNLVAEVIEDLGIQDKTIGVSPVGCSVFAYNYLHIDWSQAAHGRACAVATAIKRTNPDKMVFTYQGDGDLAAIGTAETIHACNRGENIVVIFINNAIYGMTGGQMAPTTLVGMKTATSRTDVTRRYTGSPTRLRHDSSASRRMLCNPSVGTHPRCRAQGKEGYPQGIRERPRRQGTLLRRNGFDLQQRLEDVPG